MIILFYPSFQFSSQFFFFYLILAHFKVRRMLFICQKVSLKQMSTKMSNFKPKKDTLVENKSKRDAIMENVRIVQKNLVFVSGLPGSIADSDLLKTTQYFGRYGKVSKIVTNPQQPLRKPCSYQAYVTYGNALQAAIAITALDGFNYEQKPLKVSFGTTKYCAHFLRGYDCLNPDCFYLHEYDRKNQVFNKDTKSIFEEQNQEAMDIVYENIDEIVQRIARERQRGNENGGDEDGFPTLMEMMEFLVQSKIIQEAQFKALMKKHQNIKIPKLVSTISCPPPVKNKPDSPKQAPKLTKSNSFSTVGSPTKSQIQTDAKTQIPSQKQQTQQKMQSLFNSNNSKKSQRPPQNEAPSNPSKPQKKQRTHNPIEPLVLTQPISNQNPHMLSSSPSPSASPCPQKVAHQQQISLLIQKQFLKHIYKLTDKSKNRSKMEFAGEAEWEKIRKIKEIVQKNLINFV